MNCTSCQTQNSIDAKFCMQCGASLGSRCPQCAAQLPTEARFCQKCGHRLGGTEPEPAESRLHQYIPKELLAKLESARAAGRVQGERRIVTMLFCDVQGSTAAAEKLDPEEWTEIMNGAFEHLIAPVYRYEGTVARLMGDAILAFFGAPITHEDDPQRAVLAALDIIGRSVSYRGEVQRSWGVDFNVRVGINTGLVVVGEVGSDLRVEYTAMGDAINLAARMEQTAEPGTVQISGATYRLVAPLFDVEDLGGVEVKGKEEPVQSYRVLRQSALPGKLRGIAGLDSEMVGREDEIKTLIEGIEALRYGRAQIFSIIGEAGLGKSRLVAELRHTLAAGDALATNGAEPGGGGDDAGQRAVVWYEGRSLSFESSTAYAPFASLLSSCFDLRPEQTDEEQYESIKSKIGTVLPDRIDDTAPFIATLLGTALSDDEAGERVRYLEPPPLRERVFVATCDFLKQLATTQPLVLVFEDLHWVDPTSLELLERVLAITDQAPLMVIGVFRPWRQDPSWRFHETATRDYSHRYTPIQLEPLDRDDSRQLVANLLHVEDLPEKVCALILTKSEGNPFFVEEVIRSLLDSALVVRENSHWRATREIENIAIPDTLAGVINARLDRLDEGARRVVQTAAVIGREFQFDALTSVYEAEQDCEVALAELERRELVREKSRIPLRVYMFKHTLTQEAAYGTLLLSTRRELHRRVAECLEQAEPDRANDIARHFLEAQEQARALPYLVEAGDRAARAYSTPAAIESYRKALEILDTTTDVPLTRRAHEGLGSALTSSFNIAGAVETYHTMLHVAQEHEDIPMQVSALNKLGFVTALMRGEFPEAEKHLEGAERLAQSCNDLLGLAELHMTYCYIYTSTGDFDGALGHQKESLQIGRDLDVDEPRLFGLAHIANTMTYLTRFDEAWETADEARKKAEELGNRKYLSEALTFPIPLVHLRNGDMDLALEAAEEGMNIGAHIGASAAESGGAFLVGQIAWLKGEYEGAIESQQRALEAGRTSGMSFLQVGPLCALGTIYQDISMELTSETMEYHAQALELMGKPLGTAQGAMNWAEVGFCALAMGDVERACELFHKGLTTSTAMKYLARPQLLVGSAFVELAKGRSDEAAKLVHEAQQFVEERAMQHLYAFVAFASAQVSAAQGGRDQALDGFTRAEEQALRMQMRPLVWQARAGVARVLSAAGRTSKAEAKRAEARDMVDEIAGLFKDEKLRGMFLEGATRKLA